MYQYFCCLCLFLFTPRVTMAAEPMSLEKYLETVKLKNRTFQASPHSLEAAYYGVLASVGYQRPALAASIGASYLTDREESAVKERNITSANVDLNFSWRIDINGSYSLDEQQQILSYENQRVFFDDGFHILMAATEDVYWSAAVAREDTVLQKDALRQRRENLYITEEKFNYQLVPKLDIVRAESQVVAAESLVSRAEAQYLNILVNMSDLVGGAKIVPAEDPLTVPVFDSIDELEKNILSRPDIHGEHVALERSRIVKKLTAKGLSLSLEVDVTYSPFAAPSNSSSPQKNEAIATLRINIPISNGNKTKYKILNSDRLVLAEEEKLEALQNTANKEFAIAWVNWKDASMLEQDKKRQVEWSDEELALTELLYTEGMGAQIDLLNAQTDNQQVRTEYLRAIGEMYTALVALRKAAGSYAPNERGGWKDAVLQYGKGDKVSRLLTRNDAERLEQKSKAQKEMSRRKKSGNGKGKTGQIQAKKLQEPLVKKKISAEISVSDKGNVYKVELKLTLEASQVMPSLKEGWKEPTLMPIIEA
jgi:outer membrane protein TolC